MTQLEWPSVLDFHHHFPSLEPFPQINQVDYSAPMSNLRLTKFLWPHVKLIIGFYEWLWCSR